MIISCKTVLTHIFKCRIKKILGCRMSSTIRIGCASGFWGDTATSVPPLVHDGNVDFIVFDYLSEITMSLLSAAKQKNPEMGYTPDFVTAAMAPNLKEIHKRNIKVVSNAGGMNPHACADALRSVAKNMGIEFKIAVISGDNLLPEQESIKNSGVTDMDKGFPYPKQIHSMNAYLGAFPISKALDMGADIVITGRCVDSALVLGPLINKFHWSIHDYDMLASGSLAGHLLECGAQSTGGIHTDWHLTPDWHNMGFPIAECKKNGEFTISKPPKTGGMVSVGTVSEQLLYEIGDPQNYLLPDVTCDFSHVNLSKIAENTVLVQGAKGKAPSKNYKVSATFSDGYRATAVCPIIGDQATLKAKRTAESILARSSRILKHLGFEEFRRTHLEILGSEHHYGKSSEIKNPREVVMWLAVHHDKKEAISLFAKEIAAAATGAAPGLTSLLGGRPKPTPILRLFSFLYPKEKVQVNISLEGKTEEHFHDQEPITSTSTVENKIENSPKLSLLKGTKKYRLAELAFTRSGDKGDTCNIGVIARNPAFLPYIQDQLTSDTVSKYFEHLFSNKTPVVKRYSLPGLYAINFVLESSLGGGGVASLRSDPQGKACGQILADFTLHDMPDIEALKEK